MPHFCTSDIWQEWLDAWATPQWPPPVTCLQALVMDAAPCALFLVTCPIYVVFLLRMSRRPRAVCPIFICKLVLSLIFSALCAACAVVKGTSGDTVLVLMNVAWTLASIVSVAMLALERSSDRVRSMPLFFLWLAATLNYALLLLELVSSEDYLDDVFDFYALVAGCALSLCNLLLNCWAHSHVSPSPDSNPEAAGSPLSWLTYSWLDRLMWSGFKKPLGQEDMYKLLPEDTSAVAGERFQASWDSWKAARGYQPSLARCLLKTFWWEACVAHVGTLLVVASNLIIPFIIAWLIDYSHDGSTEPTWHGYAYLAAILVARLVGAGSDQVTQYLCNRLAIRARSATSTAIFAKALRMRQGGKRGADDDADGGGQYLGEIVNLVSVDTVNLEGFCVHSHTGTSGILHLVLGGYFCYAVCGPALFAGMGFIVLMFGVNFLTNHKFGTYQGEILAIQDRRLRVMGEVLEGIQVIKLHGWEVLFSKKVTELRKMELKVLFKVAIFGVVETFAFTVSKFWMTFSIVATFVTLDRRHHLIAREAYLIINFIQIINMAVLGLPMLFKLAFKMKVSVGRINKFLQCEELSEADMRRDPEDPLALRIEKADFKWEMGGETILKEINVLIESGKLVAVVGTVGSGKSSLLAAALGEMLRESGYCNINSTVSHVPQEAWIQNLSIRDNILSGRDMDETWYHKVIKACALQPDLDMLPHGDATEIGEKGINLSGGQKQRISLARAVYSQADICLLDDPLSAVDSHVGKEIFQKVIGANGLLQGKTRVLVTHGLQWLPHVDYIYVMENGRVSESGTFTSLTASTEGAFAKLVSKFQLADKQSHTDRNRRSKLSRGSVCSEDGDKGSPLSLREISPSGSALIASEQLGQYQVNWSVYASLFKAFGVPFLLVLLLFVAGYHTAYNFFYITLSVWADDSDLANFTLLPADSAAREDENWDYLTLIIFIGIAQTVGSLTYASVNQYRHVITSRVLHDRLLGGVMAAPISFFQTTPTGRIMNRFSQDLDQLDSFVFFSMEIALEHALFSLGILLVISTALPYLSIVAIPSLVLIYLLQRFYSRSAFRLRCLASVNHSPVVAHLSETVSGLSVIRAHLRQGSFLLDNQRKIDRFQEPTHLTYAANKWMQFRLDILGCFLIVSAVLYVIIERGNVQPGLVGLALSIAFALSSELKATSLRLCELDNSMVAVERILEYSSLESEAPWNLPSDDDIDGTSRGSCGIDKPSNPAINTVFTGNGKALNEDKPILKEGVASSRHVPYYMSIQDVAHVQCVDTGSQNGRRSLSLGKAFSINGGFDEDITSHDDANVESYSRPWPQTGKIEFVEYSCRYRKGTELVLKEISFTIRGGEKIGVVGRTGAGKTSLVLSLFRMVEAAAGRILIDGVDVSSLGLHRLRQSLTILPQDPMLFAGTVRENLDPTGQRSDVDLWMALSQAHLGTMVQGMPGKLSASVGDKGGNFSQGQRQLMCLARTLLTRSRVLVLDEATASVDLETDSVVQKTIRSAFSRCTVIAIAHRISTVMDYDRVLVLEQGRIAEFDSPQVLLADSSSIFHSMVQEFGAGKGQGSEAAEDSMLLDNFISGGAISP